MTTTVFKALQALDHRDTVTALKAAMPEDETFPGLQAEHLATELAQAGYALVHLAEAFPLPELADPDEPGFLDRVAD